MTAIGPRAFLLATWIFASAARAETEVKAEDCSAALSETIIGAKVEIHCLSKEDISRVVDELVRTGRFSHFFVEHLRFFDKFFRQPFVARDGEVSRQKQCEWH